MNNLLNDPINIEIRENEKTRTDRALHDLAEIMYQWTDIFNTEFFKDHLVPVPAISFEKEKTGSLGHYVIGRNGFGIRENININQVHLNRPLWDILATLAHEMCHSWQGIYGKPSKSWFHNKEFRAKMAEIGILVNEKGCHGAVGEPFMSVLKEHGVEVNGEQSPDGMIRLPPKEKPKGRSKLKKWSCGCTNIRVAIKELEAQCLRCGNKFELVE
jgi:hypothetical protein